MSLWYRTQHSTTTSSLGIFHPGSRGPARSERALSLSLSPLLARFRGSYPCRARSPPSSAAPLTQASQARLSVPRSPLCPPANGWAERESPAPESSCCTPGTRSPRPELGRARQAAEHLPRFANADDIAWNCRMLARETTGSCPSGAHPDLTPRLWARALIPGAWRGREDDLHSTAWDLDLVKRAWDIRPREGGVP